MRIDGVTAVPLRVPVRDSRSALGDFDHYDYGLVAVHTDTGLVGYGEISTLWDGAGDVQVEVVRRAFASRLAGRDPLELTACLDALRTLREPAEAARAACDMALHDLVGKALGVPVYQLLGGRTRDGVVQSRSILMDSPERMGEAAERAVAEGYTCVKVKLGRGSHVDLACVSAVRSAIGDETLLRVDANMAWPTVKEAIAEIRRLEPFGLHSVEQPMPRRPLADWRRLRDAVDVPVMLDESVWGPDDAWSVLTGDAADMLNVYVAEAGGLAPARLVFDLADLAGVPCVVGSMPELGIGTAAAVALATGVRTLDHPCDTAGSTYQVADIVAEPVAVRDGKVYPSSRPGLGVELDWDAVATMAGAESARGVAQMRERAGA